MRSVKESLAQPSTCSASNIIGYLDRQHTARFRPVPLDHCQAVVEPGHHLSYHTWRPTVRKKELTDSPNQVWCPASYNATREFNANEMFLSAQRDFYENNHTFSPPGVSQFKMELPGRAQMQPTQVVHHGQRTSNKAQQMTATSGWKTKKQETDHHLYWTSGDTVHGSPSSTASAIRSQPHDYHRTGLLTHPSVSQKGMSSSSSLRYTCVSPVSERSPQSPFVCLFHKLMHLNRRLDTDIRMSQLEILRVECDIKSSFHNTEQSMKKVVKLFEKLEKIQEHRGSQC